MKRYYALLFIFVPFLNLSLLCQESALEFVESIPKDNYNVFFRTIPFIAVDEQGVVYATDNRDHIIYKIDYISDNVKIIGRPGQGPGDLNHPWLTFVEGANLYVGDDVGINIYNKDGTFQNRFRIFNKLVSLTVYKDIVYVIEAGTDKLITCYDRYGKRLNSFGIKYEWNSDIYKGWRPDFIDGVIHDGKLLIGNNAIYFVSYYFGELYKYDLAGRFLSKQIIADEDIIEKNREYYFKVGQVRDQRGTYNTNRLFNDACYFNGKIYVLLGIADAGKREYDEIIEIDENNVSKRVRLLLSKKRANETSFGYRSIACGLNKWVPNIFVSLYDDKEEKFLINIYRRRLKDEN